MENREAESGLELVLDNRKLVIAFSLLIAICGCFFVVGFIEGKRQGVQEGSQTTNESLAKKVPDAVPPQIETTAPSKEELKSPPQDAADQPLDWYKNINRRGKEPVAIPSTAASDSASKSPAPASATVSTEKPKPPVSAEPATYSVQVGAFRQREDLETWAQKLREKGFDCRIEPPAEPGQFYLLKVGNFRTRAEASAMQLRLKKEGFASFIKTK
jgi:cell division protein FtsN